MTFLTGMETSLFKNRGKTGIGFMTFLTGMETPVPDPAKTRLRVHDLPNRDGNILLGSEGEKSVLVHDLPNRDGN